MSQPPVNAHKGIKEEEAIDQRSYDSWKQSRKKTFPSFEKGSIYSMCAACGCIKRSILSCITNSANVNMCNDPADVS